MFTTSHTTRTLRHPLIGITLAGTLLLAACGSDDDTSAGSGDAASTVVSESAADEPIAEPADDPGGGEAAAAEPAEPLVADDESATDVEPADEPVAEEATRQSTTDSALPSSYLDSYTLIDEEFGTMTTVTVDGSTRTIETNALPDHETGEFPNDGNPNAIEAQDLTWEFTTEPTFVGNATEVRTSGVAVNGVKFEPGTAETLTCASGETYRIEALQDLYDLGLDFNNAHVQPGGEYHYHGISELLVGAYESDEDLVHIGFASDGYLIYYSKSGAYTSSYQLSTDARTGTDCLASGPAGTTIDVEGTTPDGTYTSDYEYVEGSGALDECNGTTIDGEYVYLVTDTFPYITRCLNGEVSGEQNLGAGPPPGGRPDA